LSVENFKLDTSRLRKFAQFARKALHEQVSTQLDAVLQSTSMERREYPKAIAKLEELLQPRKGSNADAQRELLVERVAYTWFNRFCALRYMDVNRYTRIGIVSPLDGQFQPEILGEAKLGHIDEELVPEKLQVQVADLLSGKAKSSDPQSEAYRILFVAACNYYHKLLPFMFEPIVDYTELLLPADLLSGNSVLTHTREALLPANCSPEYTDQSVEVIGWLYQFYISEKKDDVFAALKKGKKISPENLPAATQLFTPHWIVRYLVENSLGRLWMLNNPDSHLVEQMDYYIKLEEPETDFLRISGPEEIKVCDPACGSGHMLTYSFDLLYAIYEEQGYQSSDIPQLILNNNLYGVEIDLRARSLAAFALTMKAREKYRRFLTSGKVVQPNICVLENIEFDKDELSQYMDQVGRDLFTQSLEDTLHQFEEADNFGSLIRPRVTDVKEVLELLPERQMGEDLFLAGVHRKVLTALRQADYLSSKYHVVVANPPYMGGKGMSSTMKSFAAKHFPESKSDVFAMFMERGLSLIVDSGLMAMINMQSWMFLSSFEKLRAKFLSQVTLQTMAHLGERAFDTIGGAVVSTTAFVVAKHHSPAKLAHYLRLVDGENESEKSSALRRAANDLNDEIVFRAASQEFQLIPGAPIAYWVSQDTIQMFADHQPLGDVAQTKVGLQTGNNEKFLRLWHEVEMKNLCRSANGRDTALESAVRWFPCNKGGEFRKWYGNQEHVVNWEHDGSEIRNFTDGDGSLRSRPQNMDFYFREAISWSDITTYANSFRFYPAGFINDATGHSAFGGDLDWKFGLMCYCNNAFVNHLSRVINPTIHFHIGYFNKLPFAERAWNRETIANGQRLTEIAKTDWDSLETSWDFVGSPLVNCQLDSDLLRKAYGESRDFWTSMTPETKQLEEGNNRTFLNEYELHEEFDSVIESDQITLWCNPAFRYDEDKSQAELEQMLLADTMREFISYAVGCMLGRYSLNKPGLILANQGETTDDYRQHIPEPTFAPDEDNVIPLLDGDWFTDDISERFKAFLKVTFGTEHFDENLTFLENALYPDNGVSKKRKTIRDYFLKEFYNHHIKLYKKRPIYWLFSSPKGTFNALIYMHRYRSDTVSVVLNGYLREFQTKLRGKLEQLQHVADIGDATKAEKTKALKTIETLNKQLKELEDYERDILFPLAQQQIEIDLDKGVKHNYPLFGKALKKVTGLS
jgi:type II restriction/modification system DNA methylase subunit YeeA